VFCRCYAPTVRLNVKLSSLIGKWENSIRSVTFCFVVTTYRGVGHGTTGKFAYEWRKLWRHRKRNMCVAPPLPAPPPSELLPPPDRTTYTTRQSCQLTSTAWVDASEVQIGIDGAEQGTERHEHYENNGANEHRHLRLCLDPATVDQRHVNLTSSSSS